MKISYSFNYRLIDVLDCSIIDYHLGLSCTSEDACRVLKNALKKRQLAKGMKLPKIRTDNSPQFIAKKFAKTCKYLE